MRTFGLLLGFACLVACADAASYEAARDDFDTDGGVVPTELANLAIECEPGQHAVAQRVRVFDDDGSWFCAFTPLGAYACLEGLCGDGVCEPEEDVPCGCSLDCAIED